MASVRSHISWLPVSEALEIAALTIEGSSHLRVLDIGGGAGVDAVRVAQLGHDVTVVDQSSDALAALQRRAYEANVQIEGIQGDGEDLSSIEFEHKFDLALCHGVIETSVRPRDLLKSIGSVLKPQGTISVQAPGLVAAAKFAVSRGDLETAAAYVVTDIDDWNIEALGPRRFSCEGLGALLESTGFSVVGVRGVRVFDDVALAESKQTHPAHFDLLLELEQKLRQQQQFAAGSGGLQAIGRLD